MLIPVFNDNGHLATTLQSLGGQGARLTAVIVDDGSEPALAIDRAGLDFPVVLLRQPVNGGIECALNAGLAYITAHGFEYIARLDNGDRCAPGRLARQEAFLDANPDVHLVGSNVEWRTDDGQRCFTLALPTTHEAIVRALHHTVCLIHPAVMFRTTVIEGVGVYSTAYPAAEDYEFFWRIARRFRVANIPETLLTTRFDPGGISIRKRGRQLRSKLRIQLEFFRADEPLSYVGIAKTLTLLLTPYALVVQLKRLLSPSSVS